MTKRDDALPPRALAAYLEGEVTPSEARGIEAHLRDSASARRHLEQLDDIRRTLTRLPDGMDEAELAAVEDLRRAIEAAPPAPGARGARRLPRIRVAAWLGAGACAAVAVVLLVRGAGAPGGGDAEFRARPAAVFPEDRWVGIDVLRVGADGAARPLPGDALHARDGLVFRYVNGGPDPFGFLMVFAIDAAAQIHWYYPAYETADADPMSVPIRSEPRRDALPDVIDHDLRSGPLVFYGLFTRAPLHVVDVEHRVSELVARRGWDPDRPPRLPFDGSGQHVMHAVVIP
ncbi:MAG TPA: hypothetical protein VHW23_07760 [Kofleriaceae bacterium]|jgi:hypothetical protein|nr:hypothetical protein [Kofleriaceae bacterium]